MTGHDISSATRIVAQMGQEPYIKAMEENPDFDVIIGGRAYDPSPYAAYCSYKGFKNQGILLRFPVDTLYQWQDADSDLGLNYAMGKILECGAQCSIPKSREALAIVTEDYVDVMALDPKSHMTTVSVASHFLYEKSRPDILQGPGGSLHLEDTTYEQVGYNLVRLRGARFEPEPEGEYTLKLEAARTIGFYTVVIGAFRDPILIAQLDYLISTLKAMIKERLGDTPYDL